MSLDTAILRPVSPFLRLGIMETLSASNSTSNNENSRGNALVLHWYVLLIIIIVVIAVAVLFYRACCARSTNKRKLHGLINEVRAEALTKWETLAEGERVGEAYILYDWACSWRHFVEATRDITGFAADLRQQFWCEDQSLGLEVDMSPSIHWTSDL